MSEKALRYVYGSGEYILYVSILNLQDRSRNSKLAEDWRVDLSIWRVDRKYINGKFRPSPNKSLDRIEVYPDISDLLSNFTIFKQDLVTVHREQDESLRAITINIDLESVIDRIVVRAVRAMENARANPALSSLPSDQLTPSLPFANLEEGSYQDEEGSEKDTSQRKDIKLRFWLGMLPNPSSPINNNSQDNALSTNDPGLDELEPESDVEGTAGIGDSRGIILVIRVRRASLSVPSR